MTAEVGLELALVTGERKALTLPSHTGSVGAALDRLHDWIETDDGSWVQKRFVVEVRIRSGPIDGSTRKGSTGELSALEDAVDEMLDKQREEWPQRDD
jgi:hypothetical protein